MVLNRDIEKNKQIYKAKKECVNKKTILVCLKGE